LFLKNFILAITRL